MVNTSPGIVARSSEMVSVNVEEGEAEGGMLMGMEAAAPREDKVSANLGNIQFSIEGLVVIELSINANIPDFAGGIIQDVGNWFGE